MNLSNRSANPSGTLMGVLLLLAIFAMSNTPALAAGLITVGPTTAQTNGGYFINTYNSGGVQNGLASNLGTMFTLASGAQTYNISQVITYHFNGGQGAPAGQITIETYQQTPIRTVNAVNVGGVNWVATFNPPLQLPPGIYIVRDSSPSTWSNNSGSAGCLWFSPSFQCGFVRMTGSVTPLLNNGSTGGGSGSSSGSGLYHPATQIICTSSPVPAGWLVTNQTTSFTSCPYYGSYLTDNVEAIEQYSPAPVGTTLAVCTAWAATPPGWVVVNQTTVFTSCPYYGKYLTNNIKTIKRIN